MAAKKPGKSRSGRSGSGSAGKRKRRSSGSGGRQADTRAADQALPTPPPDAEATMQGLPAEPAPADRQLRREAGSGKQAEPDLPASEGQYRELLSNLPVGVYRTTGEGRFISANPALVKMAGCRSEEELLAIPTVELYADPRDRERLIGRLGREGSLSGYEIRVRRRDGALLWVSLDVRAEVDRQGNVRYLEGVALDVTEQKRVEETLRQSEERFRLLYERSPLGYQSLDEEGRFIEVNPAWLATLGYAREEVIGSWFGDFLAPEYVERFRERFPQFKAMGETDRVQFAMVRKDGERILVEFNGRVGYDEEGNFQQTHCIMRDVTAQKQAEEALRESESRYRSFVQNFQGIAYRGDMHFRPLFFHGAVEKITGYTEAEFLAAKPKWDDIIHPEDLAEVYRHAEHVRSTPEFVGRFEYRIVRKDGQTRWICDHVQNTCDDSGTPVFVQGALYDITERKRAEETLRESEAKSRAILEAMPDLMFRLSRDGVHLDFHAPSGDRLYVLPEKFMGKRVQDVLPIDVADKYLRHTGESLDKGGMQVFEYELEFSPQDRRHYEARMVPAGKDDVLVLVREVTQRKQAEEAIQYEAAMRSILLENLPCIAIVLKNETREIVYSNQAARRVGAVPGKTCYQTCAQRDDPCPFCRAPEVWATDSPRQIEVEYRGRHYQGRWTPLGDDLYVHYIFDITDLKLAEDKLRESEERLRKTNTQYRRAQEIGQLGSFEADLGSGEQVWSDQVFAMLGVKPGEVPCSLDAFLEFVHPDDRDRLSRASQETFAGNRNLDILYRIVRKDGEERHVHTQANLESADDGAPARIYGFSQDVTESKRAEEELARAREAAEDASLAKSEFLANVSHEIRTPMTAVMGFTDLLLSCELPPGERREHLQTIRRNADSLLAIINDILDLSKIEAGRIELEQYDCAPAEIVEEVLSVVKLRAEQKGLDLDVDYRFPLPKTFRTDPVRLRQILVNLVGNAVKFTQTGGVRITVRCRRPMKALASMQFEITDTGIGMTDEEIQKLFRPFTQADSSHSRRFGGTGLGLSISQRLAGMLGGRIDVRSTLGRGSSFTLTIDPGPLQGVAMLSDFPAKAAAEEKPIPADRDRTFEGRVLLAEDGSDVRELVGRVLEVSGMQVDLAENGRVALDMALAAETDGKPYDLILMDVQMPVLDGLKATLDLRRRGFQGPIIALTAHAMTGDRRKCLEAGCDDYVPKPIDPKELFSAMARCLGQAVSDSPEPADDASTGGASGIMGSRFISDADKAELMAQFAAELPERVGRIERALAGGDLQTLGGLAHQLKGCAAVYGLAEVSATAGRVDQGATDGADLKKLQATVAELCELCRQTRLLPPARRQGTTR